MAVPEIEPGTAVSYSYFGNHAIIAEIVRRLDGGNRRFREIVKSDLLEPLGMMDTTLGLPEDKQGQQAEMYAAFETAGKNIPAEFNLLGPRMTNPGDEIPGGGYFSTAADISRFARMLCNRGELDGVRILSAPMVERMHRLETGEQINSFWNYSIGHRHWRPMPAEFTLGFFRRGEGTHPAGFGILASADTIGGYGAGTTCFWVDPVRRMTYSHFFPPVSWRKAAVWNAISGYPIWSSRPLSDFDRRHLDASLGERMMNLLNRNPWPGLFPTGALK